MIDGYFTGYSLQLQRQHCQVRGVGLPNNTVKLRGSVRQHSQVTGNCQTTQFSYGGLPDNTVKLRGSVRPQSQVTGNCQTTQSSYGGLPDNTV